MSQPKIEKINLETLVNRVRQLKKDGHRLVQISATRLADELELTYSFDRDGSLVNLRLNVAAHNAKIPSVTSVFWCAFLYENELHDLFSLEVEGMAVDFKGNLYRTAVKFPFGSYKAPPGKPSASSMGAAQITQSDAERPGPATNSHN